MMDVYLKRKGIALQTRRPNCAFFNVPDVNADLLLVGALVLLHD